MHEKEVTKEEIWREIMKRLTRYSQYYDRSVLFIALAISIVFSVSAMNGEVQFGVRPFIDIYEVPDEAIVMDLFRIEFDNKWTEHLDSIEITIDANGNVVFGIAEIDELNQLYSVHTVIKMFDSPALKNSFEWRHRHWGFHLWFELHYTSEEDIRDVITAYRDLDDIIKWAEPEYKKELASHSNPVRWTPDDPRLGEQWHYDNVGDNNGTPGADIDLFNAWDIEKGHQDVIIAIIDGGIMYDHPDLAGNMWQDIDGNFGYNFVADSTTINYHFHGTHVAGTVAAISNNEIGVAGIAGGSGLDDGVRLMSCQIFDGNNGGGFHLAPIFAADNGAAVSQNSWWWGIPIVYEEVVLNAIDYFNTNGGGEVMNGGLTIFIAGNSGTEGFYYPGAYSGALSVAATNNRDEKAFYSTYGLWVDISAPGGEIHQVNERGVLSTSTVPELYQFLQGTSMAAPHVSGVAALIISKAYRDGWIISSDLVWDILERTADDHYGVNPNYLIMLGSGRVNAYMALQETQQLFAGGQGTEQDPWQVDTANHLDNVRYFVGPAYGDKHFIQTSDIDLGVPSWNQGEGWIPIGEPGWNSFRGTYNGNGKQISNLFIERDADYQGLFGYLWDGKIYDLNLVDVCVTGRNIVGSLAGEIYHHSQIYNCSVTGNVYGEGDIDVGGLVGFMTAFSSVKLSHSSASVAGNSRVGGLIGRSNSHGSVSHCYSIGTVSGTSQVGGLIGQSNTAAILKSYSAAFVEGEIDVGGLVGISDSTFPLSYWDIDASGQTGSAGGEGRSTLLMLQESNYSYWDFDDTWEFVDFNPYTRERYPTLRWQDEPGLHSKIDNAFVKRFRGGRKNYWESFPRLEIQNDQPHTLAILDDLAGTIEYVLGNHPYDYLEWDENEQVFEGDLAFSGRYGYKLDFTDHDEYYMYVWGPQYSYNTTLTIEPGQENWIGYFIPVTQNVFDAFGTDVMDQLQSVKADEWGMYRQPKCGTWLYYQAAPNYLSAQLAYGKMYSVVPLSSVQQAIEFEWNYNPPVTPPDDFETLPKAQHFSFNDGPDYESFFIESIEDDEDVLEVAVYAGDECVGASVFMGIYPFEILSFTNESHLNEDISFAIYRDELRGQPEFVQSVEVKNNYTGDFSSRAIKPLKQTFTVVRLGRGEGEIEPVVKPQIILSQNYPNPFSLSKNSRSIVTEIPFFVSEQREVTLSVFNIKGQKVKELFSGVVNAGNHSVAWNGMNEKNRQVGSGVYFYRLESGDKVLTKKMLLIR